MTMVIIILIILLIMAYFYLKCSVIASLSTLILAILATFVALSYYEILAELFVSRGYGIPWAHTGCYTLAFILSFALLRALRDLLIGGTKLELGEPIKIAAAVVCGLVTGIIACGNLLIAIGLSPAHHKMLYSRFDPTTKVSIKNPNKSFLNTDGFVAGLYATASRGALSSSKSFAVLHTDYLTQIHLNRLQTKQEKITAVTSKKALQIPSGKKKPVRIFDIDGVGKATVVRMGLVAKNIQDGGAGNPAESGKIDFIPAQIRIISKPNGDPTEPARGSGTAYYPIGLMDNGNFTKTDLKQVINPATPKNKNRPIWVDVVFDIPQGERAMFIQFKQNALAELPEAVPTSEEIEQALNSADEDKKKEGDSQD